MELTMTPEETAGKQPARFLNYPGNVSATIVGEVHGPTTMGEHLVAVTADYSPDADRTRVGYAYTDRDALLASLQRAWGAAHPGYLGHDDTRKG